MELHLLRHTEPDIPKGYCYGQKDVGLSENYPKELPVVQDKLDGPYDRVLCSPLQRCQRLVTDLGFQEAETHQSLLELHFGDWEGQAWQEIPQDELSRWMNDFVREKAPNGESLEILYERVKNLLEELKAQKQGKQLLITHGGVIRCAWIYALDFPLENLFRLELPFGSLSKLYLDRKGPGIHQVGVR